MTSTVFRRPTVHVAMALHAALVCTLNVTHSDWQTVLLAASLCVQGKALPQCTAQSSNLPTSRDASALVTRVS